MIKEDHRHWKPAKKRGAEGRTFGSGADAYLLYMWIILFVEAYRFDEVYAEKVRKKSGRRIETLLEKLTA